MTAPAISAIVPVYNKIAFLRASLDSIVAAARQHGNVELVFVDHQSTDGSWELLAEYACVASIHRMRGGTISAVRNFGVRQSRAPLLAFIDCDCVVPASHFAEMQRVFAGSNAVAAGREYDIPAAPHWTERTWYGLHALQHDNQCRFINAGNFAVRRAAFESIGGFDEALGTGEDSDICARLSSRGGVLLETGSLNVVHLGNPKSVAAFFRKQLWHGSGILYGGSMRLDKATSMIVAHGVAVVSAAAAALVPGIPWMIRIVLLLALLLAVPTATVAYRAIEGGRVHEPVRAIALYSIYYLARVIALVRALSSAMRPRHRAPFETVPRADA